MAGNPQGAVGSPTGRVTTPPAYFSQLNDIQTAYKNAQEQINHVLSNVPAAIQFIIDAGNKHPNRIDICKGAEAGGAPGTTANAFQNTAAPSSNPFGAPAAPATTVGGFGQPAALGQKPSPFGAPTSAFGQPAQPAASAFGQPAALGATSAFGRPPQTTSAFGQPAALGAKPSAFGAPAFGQPAQPASAPGAFGQPAQPASAPGAFGQPAQPASAPGAFGQTGFGQTATLGPKPSPFGAPPAGPGAFGAPSANNTQQAANPFGQPPQQAQTASPFGQPAPNVPPGNSPFGQPVSAPANPFGQPQQQPQQPANPFGQPVPNNQPAVNPFGQPITAPAPAPATAFGQPSTSAASASSAGPASGAQGPYGPNATRQHPDINSYSSRGPDKILRMFKGKPVAYEVPKGGTKPVPVIRNFDGSMTKIWMPDGAPKYTSDTEADPAKYEDPNVQQQWRVFMETGRFAGGLMPEVPPKREFCAWDF